MAELSAIRPSFHSGDPARPGRLKRSLSCFSPAMLILDTVHQDPKTCSVTPWPMDFSYSLLLMFSVHVASTAHLSIPERWDPHLWLLQVSAPPPQGLLLWALDFINLTLTVKPGAEVGLRLLMSLNWKLMVGGGTWLNAWGWCRKDTRAAPTPGWQDTACSDAVQLPCDLFVCSFLVWSWIF